MAVIFLFYALGADIVTLMYTIIPCSEVADDAAVGVTSSLILLLGGLPGHS